MPVAREGYIPTVRGECRILVVGLVPSEVLLASAISIHREDVSSAVLHANEDYFGAVGRPVGILVAQGGVVGELNGAVVRSLGAVGVYYVNLPVIFSIAGARKGNLRTVRGNGGGDIVDRLGVAARDSGRRPVNVSCGIKRDTIYR
jgi:hypothetical protein